MIRFTSQPAVNSSLVGAKIHVYADVKTETAHKEFLGDHSVDGLRRLAERLVTNLKGTGSIVVYCSFEKRIIDYLRALFPIWLTSSPVLSTDCSIWER